MFRQDFMSFGPFSNLEEAANCAKYIKTKFLHFCLEISKITQNNPRKTGAYIPLCLTLRLMLKLIGINQQMK